MAKLSGFIISIILFFFLSFNAAAFWGKENTKNNFGQEFKSIILNDDGLIFKIKTQAETVEYFLKEQELDIKDEDQLFPEKNALIHSSSIINVKRIKNVTLVEGKNKIAGQAFGKDVASAIWENNINLGEDDIISPSLLSPISDGEKIEIIRVVIQEMKVTKDIEFKKIIEEDDELGWRVNKIKQKGMKGKKEITYKVVSHNGKEISRKVLSEEIVKEATAEISVQGTYVKLGKSHSGAASWYSFTGQMTAANPWLPMGSYVKATNKSNGKSVIVKIVDRGPWGPGRIIDLEKVAFAKIADIGAGVIDVKMEEILN